MSRKLPRIDRRLAFVLDVSVTLAWFFRDEADPYADSVGRFLAKSGAVVPVIWPLELANVLLSGERRRRTTRAEIETWLPWVRAQRIEVEGRNDPLSAALDSMIDLARSQALSVYDASYLELALRRGLPIASLDRRLRDDATATGVPLLFAD